MSLQLVHRVRINLAMSSCFRVNVVPARLKEAEPVVTLDEPQAPDDKLHEVLQLVLTPTVGTIKLRVALLGCRQPA